MNAVDYKRCEKKNRGLQKKKKISYIEIFNEDVKACLHSQSQNMNLLRNRHESGHGRFARHPGTAPAPLDPETLNLILRGVTWMETNQPTVQIRRTPARRENVTVPAPNRSFSLSPRMFPANPLLGTQIKHSEANTVLT